MGKRVVIRVAVAAGAALCIGLAFRSRIGELDVTSTLASNQTVADTEGEEPGESATTEAPARLDSQDGPTDLVVSSATPASPATAGPTTTTTVLTSTEPTTTGPTTTGPTTTAPTTTTTERATTTTKPPEPVALVNGGFDSVDFTTRWEWIPENRVPGWGSSTADYQIWRSGAVDATSSVDGSYLMSLTTKGSSRTISQTFATTPGTTIQVSFSHRGRYGTDSAAVSVGPRNGEGVSTVARTGRAWKVYTLTYDIPEGQTETLLSFSSVSVSTRGEGNLLDAVSVKLAG